MASSKNSDPSGEESIPAPILEPDAYVFGPNDTWQTVADRLGVNVDALFAANAGLGGINFMDGVPVGYSVQMPQ